MPLKLAIHGGRPVRDRPFPAHRTIGEEEKQAVARVLDSGFLSQYLGCWHEDFFGGPEVKSLEAEWAVYFGAKHAIAVNSCTSGLICAVGALGLGQGDEVIVPPYTMSATAVAPLVYGATPVFADVESEYFCLDPSSIERCLTSRTRAIIVTDLFGQPYDVEAINKLATTHGLAVIEDAAQAPGACYMGRFAGTLGAIGVHSLNYHKHIHCGEGGVVLTDDDRLADRIRLVRNHGESVASDMGVVGADDLFGFNFRMTEMEAAVARCQLNKLSALLEKRIDNVRYLEQALSGLTAIRFPSVRLGVSHTYYVHACLFDETIAGVSRDNFVAAVRSELPLTTGREREGVKLCTGYVRPLYLLPLFEKKSPSVGKGHCPVCERLYGQELFFHEFMHPMMGKLDLDDVVRAFEKVYNLKNKLV
jgi:perosamine synthetase